MVRDEETAVFCTTQEFAEKHAGADPANAKAVRRMDARRSFLGLEIRLTDVRPEFAQALVREAWAAQAPRTLVRESQAAP